MIKDVSSKKIRKYNISIRQIQFFTLFLYLIAISAFQLGTGFDAFFVRITFVLFVIITLFAILASGKFLITGHLKWSLCFWGFYFVSIFWADSSSDTLYYINNAIQVIGLSICLPILLKNREDVNIFIQLIIFSMIFTVLRLFLLTPSTAWGTERLGEAIGMNSNGLGLRLAIAAIMSLYMCGENLRCKENKHIVRAIFYIAAAILFGVVSFFTGSRKAVAIIILGLVAYEILITKSWKILPKIIIVVALAIMIFNFAMNNETFYSVLGRRLERMLQVFTGEDTSIDGSMVERNYYIQQAIYLFLQNPIIGCGGNNFATFMRNIGYSHVAYSHNNFTEMLATLGIIGFLIYYSIWIVTMINLIRQIKVKENRLNLLFVVIFIIILILDYWNVSYQTDFIQIILIVGYIISIKNIARQK